MRGELTLSVKEPVVTALGADITAPATLSYDLVPVLEQTLRTGKMAVNPYMAFDPLPAAVALTPAVDQWSSVSTQWASPVTQWMQAGPTIFTADQRRWGTTELIEVRFEASGFGPGELVNAVTFDDLPVNPT